MKLTVSSTAMMNPLLQTDRQAYSLAPPKRVVGLLDMNQVHPDRKTGPQKLVQYCRPDTQQAMLQTARWQDFLTLSSVKDVLCMAVFNFQFDGTNAWYQLWNCKTDRVCWLQHHDGMNYEPFALLTMNALVTLLPNWDGTLHRSPETSAKTQVGSSFEPETVDANQVNNLLVSDSSTCTAGQLWFLVTISAHSLANGMESTTIPTRSGWISPTI